MTPSKRAALISAIAMAIAGCASTAKPLPIGGPYELRPNEGLFLLEIEANSEIEKLSLLGIHGSLGKRYFANLPSGRHFHLFAIPEGEYRWDGVQMPSGIVLSGRTFPVRWGLEDEPDLHVSVRAGHLNYPGALYLYRSSLTYLSFRSLNRSGETLVWLKKKFPRLLSDYPIRYGGPGRDDFFAFYHDELRSLDAGVDPAPEEDARAPAS